MKVCILQSVVCWQTTPLRAKLPLGHVSNSRENRLKSGGGCLERIQQFPNQAPRMTKQVLLRNCKVILRSGNGTLISGGPSDTNPQRLWQVLQQLTDWQRQPPHQHLTDGWPKPLLSIYPSSIHHSANFMLSAENVLIGLANKDFKPWKTLDYY